MAEDFILKELKDLESNIIYMRTNLRGKAMSKCQNMIINILMK